jgi:hypothetical protein
VSQTTTSITDISQLSNYTINGLTGTDITLSIQNLQNLTFLNFSNMDVTTVNQFVLNEATTIFNDVAIRLDKHVLSRRDELGESKHKFNPEPTRHK